MELKAESRRDGMYDEVVVDVGPGFADIGSPEESRESLDPATAPALEPGQQETVISTNVREYCLHGNFSQFHQCIIIVCVQFFRESFGTIHQPTHYFVEGTSCCWRN